MLIGEIFDEKHLKEETAPKLALLLQNMLLQNP
jgi:hypothetical protein